ncbi:MAG: cobalt ECF transporter T component CbiQ [Planctomycetaceae bacterium]
MPADFLDPFARRPTVCHRLPVGFKLALALTAIVLASVIPIRLWPLHGCLFCLIFVAHSLAEVPVVYLLRRVALCLPFLALIALSIPFARGFSGGWDAAASVIVRGLTAFLAGLWLAATTPFERLLATLQRLRVPRVLIAMLAFMYRYTFLLFDELARMRAAQRARTFGPRRPWEVWRHNARLIAVLLIRALSRAERVHGAMCARGWRGEVRLLDNE